MKVELTIAPATVGTLLKACDDFSVPCRIVDNAKVEVTITSVETLFYLGRAFSLLNLLNQKPVSNE